MFGWRSSWPGRGLEVGTPARLGVPGPLLASTDVPPRLPGSALTACGPFRAGSEPQRHAPSPSNFSEACFVFLALRPSPQVSSRRETPSPGWRGGAVGKPWVPRVACELAQCSGEPGHAAYPQTTRNLMCFARSFCHTLLQTNVLGLQPQVEVRLAFLSLGTDVT